MTDASATIIASIITSFGAIVAAYIGVLLCRERNHSREDSRRETLAEAEALAEARALPSYRGYQMMITLIFLGLVLGAVAGIIVGGLLLGRPQAYARITDPVDGATVETTIVVRADYDNIPADRHLWLVVRIPGVGGGWLVYPQTKDADGFGTGHGNFKVTALIGGPNDSGRPFNLIVLMADENANQQFTFYGNGCNPPVSMICNGMNMPGAGVEILDFITVIRQ